MNKGHHGIYVALHVAHKSYPDVWTYSQCTQVLTATMGRQSWSWPVAGITLAALREFAQHEFRKPTGRGIVRAHITPRNQTTRELMGMDAPLTEKEFFRFWLERDRTVLVARGENTDPLPDYIPFVALEGLFSSAQLVGWRHGRAESDFLRELATKKIKGDRPHRKKQ